MINAIKEKRGLKRCYGLKGVDEVGINGAITGGNVSCRKRSKGQRASHAAQDGQERRS